MNFYCYGGQKFVMSKLYDNLNRAVKCNKTLHALHACRVIFKSYSNSVLINVFSRRATAPFLWVGKTVSLISAQCLMKLCSKICKTASVHLMCG